VTSRPRTLWAVLNATGLALALVCNALANAVPLNGMNTGQISALYPNLFVPAGLTFSIWGLIYSWLLAFVVGGVVAARRNDPDRLLERIGPWFVVNMLANGAWIFAWHWRVVPLSLLLMLVILGSLLAMYLRLGTGVRPAGALETWVFRAPISLYLGWITVATVANATALVIDLGAPPFGTVPAIVTVLVILTVVGITGRMLADRRDLVFAAVVAWALLGIVLKRSAADDEGSLAVVVAAALGLGLVGLGTLVIGLRRPRPVGEASDLV
jgi:hypothetical protein